MIASRPLPLTNECSCHFLQHHPQLLPPFQVQFWYICIILWTWNILYTLVGQVNEVRSALSDFFRSLDKGRMWWYNILGDNKGIISHLLCIDPITAGSILLTAKLVSLKKENYEPILIVKRTEWRKFIDCFGLSIEADPSKVGKNNVHFFRIGYIPSTSSLNHYISRKQLYKQFNLEPT